MAAGKAASPPTEAMRRGVSRGIFIATVVVVAVIMLVAGMYVGKAVLGSSSSSGSAMSVRAGGDERPSYKFEDSESTESAIHRLAGNGPSCSLRSYR